MSTTRAECKELRIRRFEKERDQMRVEELERECHFGPTKKPAFITDTLGDPLSRVRNCPAYEMLVAEWEEELVGVVRGTIKTVKAGGLHEGCAKVGYILGLRVAPQHRRRGVGKSLVLTMERWFISNHVEYAYMATEKDNKASIRLFVDKLGFTKFRTPAVLVHPVHRHPIRVSSGVEIKKLEIVQAEHFYWQFMDSAEFFPCDIDRVLANELSLGTWLAYPREESREGSLRADEPLPTSWAMVSVWNCGAVYKLRVGGAPWVCHQMAKISRWTDRLLPFLRVPAFPNVFSNFGYYFVYGVHGEGPQVKSLMRALFHHVHNMAAKCKDCEVIVTEVGSCDAIRPHIPHWKILSSFEDLWCIKSLRNKEEAALLDWAKAPPSGNLFVDPREL